MRMARLSFIKRSRGKPQACRKRGSGNSMKRKDVKAVITYYFGIPAKRALLAQERAELGEEAAARNRLEEISVRDQVLAMDREAIQGCLDALKGEYKRLLSMRYQDRCSWVQITVQTGVPNRTARWRHDKAVDRLGEVLEEVPMVGELLSRARCARD